MKKTASLLASAALLLVAGSAAYGQGLYGTNFDGTGTTGTNPAFTDTTVYTNGNDIVGQGNPVWVGNNDPSTEEGATNTYDGGLNSVVTGTVGPNGTTTTGSNAGQLQGQVVSGGVTVYPGKASVYVAHAFALTTTAVNMGFSYNLATDFAITPSTNGFTSGFGFAFQNTGNANLVSIEFTADPNNAAQDLIKYQVGTNAVVTITGQAITLSSVYHLNLSVNVKANTFSASFNGVTPALLSNIGLGTTSGASPAFAAALQFDANTPTFDAAGTGITNTGNDQITFDNFSITVPEPSTYAMMGLGLLGLFGLMKFRRRAA